VTSTTQQGLDAEATGAAFSERVWHDGATSPRTTQLQLNLTNVSALAVDVPGAGFRPGEAGTVSVASDRATHLVLRGLGASMGVSVDGGAPAQVLGGAGTATMAAGTHQVAFAPLPAPSPTARAGASQLPATGAPEAVLAAGGLVALLGALGLRRVVARAVVRR
jgi:hypothetical protein